MAFYKQTDPGSINGWRRKISVSMKKVAAGRTCPECHRGNAMGRTVHFPGGWAKKCRYCGHEKGASV
ncbi:MAG: hypothetical protein EPN64_05655 [Burkholderiaceae bacterium]|nr:MAG: hypothetical protein EPN64_05655 [Burkholderiaceae bacterium]